MYIYEALTGIKLSDTEMAGHVLDESEVCFARFAKYVKEHMENSSSSLEDIDIVSMAYQFIIEEAQVPALHEHIYSNYRGTTFDISSEEASIILNDVPDDQRNEAWEWVFKKTNSYLLDTANNTEEK